MADPMTDPNETPEARPEEDADQRAERWKRLLLAVIHSEDAKMRATRDAVAADYALVAATQAALRAVPDGRFVVWGSLHGAYQELLVEVSEEAESIRIGSLSDLREVAEASVRAGYSAHTP